jgi:hypothetical protein|tara:strand:+ start:3108 stop:3341 length:234 start_codon:yes stop_codon:yes gene_type:complete
LDNFNFLSGIKVFSNLEWIQKTVLIRRKKMKLETQFTVPKKELKDLDYFKKIDFLEETLKKECRDYPNQKDCLVCCN